MKLRRRIPAVISTLALISAVAACGSAEAAGAGPGTADAGAGNAKVDPAVSGYQGPNVDLKGVSLTVTTSEPEGLNMGAFFAYDKLRQWGAKVDVVILTTTSGIQTLIAGRADLASQGADEVVLGRAEGAKVTAIGSDRTKQVYVLVAKDNIKSVADLKGHTVAMSGPSGFDTLLSKYALKNAGLQSNDAKLAQVGGSPDRGAALIAGTVDAATIFKSTWEDVKPRAKGLHVLQDFGATTNFPGDAYYAKTDFLQKNPNVGLAVACANLEANDWINSDQQAYIDFTKRHVKSVDPAGLKVLWQDSQTNHYFPATPDDVISSDGLSALSQAMLDSGEIKSSAPVADAVDTSYLQKAATMGCGQKH